jgi:DNA modification methylase
MSRRIKISDFAQDERNFNRHTDAGMELLKKSIETVGVIESFTVSKDNKIITGNARQEKISEVLGFDIEPIVIETDGTRPVVLKRTDIESGTKQFHEAALLANTTAKNNISLDIELIQDIAVDMFDIDIVDLGVEIINTNIDDDIIDDNYEITEEEIKTDICFGDLFEIKHDGILHRLLCGDSTREECVKAVMNGDIADLIVTDPPYNVNFEGKKNHLKIENDNLKNDDFIDFLNKSFCNANKALKSGGSWYIFHSDSEGENFRRAVRENLSGVKQCLIWNKNNFVVGRQDYQWKHEPCLYGWKDGARHYFTDDRTQSTVYEDLGINFKKLKKEEAIKMLEDIFRDRASTTVLDENKPLASSEHPTMKPVKLLARLIRNSSRTGETVLDMFGGSGSTLMASHQLHRKCYMVEFDTKYCQVILDRFKKSYPEAELIKIGNMFDSQKN